MTARGWREEDAGKESDRTYETILSWDGRVRGVDERSGASSAGGPGGEGRGGGASARATGRTAGVFRGAGAVAVRAVPRAGRGRSAGMAAGFPRGAEGLGCF